MAEAQADKQVASSPPAATPTPASSTAATTTGDVISLTFVRQDGGNDAINKLAQPISFPKNTTVKEVRRRVSGICYLPPHKCKLHLVTGTDANDLKPLAELNKTLDELGITSGQTVQLEYGSDLPIGETFSAPAKTSSTTPIAAAAPLHNVASTSLSSSSEPSPAVVPTPMMMPMSPAVDFGHSSADFSDEFQPTASSIQSLVDMGFTSEQAENALLISNNDVATAVTYLLQS